MWTSVKVQMMWGGIRDDFKMEEIELNFSLDYKVGSTDIGHRTKFYYFLHHFFKFGMLSYVFTFAHHEQPSVTVSPLSRTPRRLPWP